MNNRRCSHNNACAWICGLAAGFFVATFYWLVSSRPATLAEELPRGTAPEPASMTLMTPPEVEIRLDGRQPFMPYRTVIVAPPVKPLSDTAIPTPLPIEQAVAPDHAAPPTRTDAPLRLFGVAEARGRRVCLIQTDSGEQCSLDRGAKIPGTAATVARIDKQSVQIVENERTRAAIRVGR